MILNYEIRNAHSFNYNSEYAIYNQCSEIPFLRTALLRAERLLLSARVPEIINNVKHIFCVNINNDYGRDNNKGVPYNCGC